MEVNTNVNFYSIEDGVSENYSIIIKPSTYMFAPNPPFHDLFLEDMAPNTLLYDFLRYIFARTLKF